MTTSFACTVVHRVLNSKEIREYFSVINAHFIVCLLTVGLCFLLGDITKSAIADANVIFFKVRCWFAALVQNCKTDCAPLHSNGDSDIHAKYWGLSSAVSSWINIGLLIYTTFIIPQNPSSSPTWAPVFHLILNWHFKSFLLLMWIYELTFSSIQCTVDSIT